MVTTREKGRSGEVEEGKKGCMAIGDWTLVVNTQCNIQMMML